MSWRFIHVIFIIIHAPLYEFTITYSIFLLVDIWGCFQCLAIMNILGHVFCGQGSHFRLGVSLEVELLGHGGGVNPTSLVLAADTGI